MVPGQSRDARIRLGEDVGNRKGARINVLTTGRPHALICVHQRGNHHA